MAELGTGCSRRQFLAGGAGAGCLVASGFLLHCAPRLAGGFKAGPRAVFAELGIDEALLQRVLTAALGAGGDYADLFFQYRVHNAVGLEDGQVNRATCSIELGCGVRTLKGEQTGFAFTEDLTSAALMRAARTAAAVAAGPARESQVAVPLTPPSYYRAEIPWAEIGVDKKVPLLQRAHTQAMAGDKRVTKVRANLTDITDQILLAASDGRRVFDVQPMAEMSVACVAEAGERREENGHSLSQRRGFEFLTTARVDEVAETAVQRTVVLFDAAAPPAGEYPVVLAPGLSGILLHEAIGHGMEADFNRKGISVYAERIGSRIAPESVTIVDDGTNMHERGTVNVDDEGQASERTVLVEHGILKSYMHDHISAEHYKVPATANGRRESYRFPPVPRMRNTYMENGPHAAAEILGSVQRGIYAETFANGQVNIGSGDFSFYLKNGFLIEGGKLTRPIKDANLIGFGPDVLAKVEMVGNDLAMYSGAGYCGKDGQRVPVGFGLPTVKCHGISVGGVS